MSEERKIPAKMFGMRLNIVKNTKIPIDQVVFAIHPINFDAFEKKISNAFALWIQNQTAPTDIIYPDQHDQPKDK